MTLKKKLSQKKLEDDRAPWESMKGMETEPKGGIIEVIDGMRLKRRQGFEYSTPGLLVGRRMRDVDACLRMP